jgi:hypothetical protein
MANSNLTPRINNLEGSHTTLNNVAQADISVISAGSTGAMEVHLLNLTPATDAVNFQVLVSIDGGSNYITAAASYAWGNVSNDSGAGVNTTSNVNQSDTALLPANPVTIGSDVAETINGKMTIYSPSNTLFHKHISWHLTVTDSGGNVRSIMGSGKYKGSTSAITHIRLKFSSGNIESGEILTRLIGT